MSRSSWFKRMSGAHKPYLSFLIFCLAVLMLTGVLNENFDLRKKSPMMRVECLTSKGDPSKLAVTAVTPTAWIKYQQKWRDLPLPVLTCYPMGRLGNVLGEYATMYAIRYLYNVSVVVHPKMRKHITAIFPNITLPDLPGTYTENEWRSVTNIGSLYNYVPVELAAAGLLGPNLFVMKNFAFEIHMFNQFRDEIRREFTLAPSYAAEVQAFLSNVTDTRRGTGHLDPVFVGFHVRRRDYADHAKRMFNATLPDAPYFARALAHFRKVFPGRAVFIAASDDVSFITSRLGQHDDVYFAPGTSAMLDLAVLSSCNHSIVTLGSYGFWSAYLTGGQVVYPDVRYYSEYRFSRYTYERSGVKHFTPLPVD
ncbi:galactoside alpha-(1,2)-fucosyltransferase 1-like isoform X2 [Panulirus ornatus]|uniref:galactoside alpha-(1,2)-fucosyltransferase 1-like isoform X2 n=1 Tax=Panulirus ornatus TaxID=150431 RepID=UPI003A878007